MLFDWRILRVSQFNLPVISVGNISAGGTGKTPFTMELIRLLNHRYKRIAVISRGYKRKSHGLQLVSDGHGFLAGVDTGGDEPVLMARRFPESVVLVSASRNQAMQLVGKHFKSDLIILDDAFQHRWVKRDVNIVLCAPGDLAAGGRLLPAGNLREPLSSLKRASLLMIADQELNGSVRVYPDLDRYYQGYIGSFNIQAECLVDSSLNPIAADESLRQQITTRPFIAFAGIANPDSFKNILQSAGVNIRRLLVFPDHHGYTEQDLTRIRGAAREENCSDLITTEKDLVKLSAAQFTGLRLLAVRIRISIHSPHRFQQKLDEFIDKAV
jgi:tetraacyldisaccharide 4'-kinase